MKRLYTEDYIKLNQEEDSLLNKHIQRPEKKGIKKASEVFDDTFLKIILNEKLRYHLSLFPNNNIDELYFSSRKSKLKDTIKDFEKILNNKDSKETDITHNLINKNEQHGLIASLGFSVAAPFSIGNHEFYIFPEFPLADSWKVDYFIIGKHSQGYQFLFIECEGTNKNIFMKDGSFGETIRKGINQVNDWKSHLESNFSSISVTLKKYSKDNTNFQNEFYQYDNSRMHYCVIAGQRKHFDKKEKSRKLQRELRQNQKIILLHYDNLKDYLLQVINK